MWTAWNDGIEQPQIWDILHDRDPALTSAVWFPLHSKGCGADYICTPAPIHNPDGSESLWCYTQPEVMYGELRDTLGHFPLQHFWGPLAGIQSTAWIVDSAIWAAERQHPNFFYIYLPHLDYAAQKTGPDSDAAKKALVELDAEIGKLRRRLRSRLTASRRSGSPPANTRLRRSTTSPIPIASCAKPACSKFTKPDDGEHLDFATSHAWALVDHQFSHVFVQDADSKQSRSRRDLFTNQAGHRRSADRRALAKYGLDHARSGDVVLVSDPNSWQAYYWWLDDARAPAFARTVDIHRKPGYDPVELFFDPARKASRSTPRWSTARTAHRPPNPRKKASCSHPSRAYSSAARPIATSTSPTSCSRNSPYDIARYDI